MDIFEDISTDSLLEYWMEVRRNIRDCLKATPPELFSWTPREGIPTFGQLYEHISGSINQWLTTVFKDGYQVESPAEFYGDEKGRLDTMLEKSFQRLEHFMGYVDLSKMYESGGKTYRGAWIIIHMFRHDVHHCAQLMVYLRQNGIEPPLII